MTPYFLPLALAAALCVTGAVAADVTITPAPGNQVVIHSDDGAAALRVAPGQKVQLPGLVDGDVFSAPVCYDAEGTLGQCDDSVIGSTGPQGLPGPQGPAGEQGVEGPQGPAGAQGAEGLPGPVGLQGAEGPQGPAGAQGFEGPQGAQGPQGLEGPQGPAGDSSVAGAQGFSARYALTAPINTSSQLVGWSVAVPAEPVGSFNAVTGNYVVPESGVYAIQAQVSYEFTNSHTTSIGSQVRPLFSIRKTAPAAEELAIGVMPIFDVNIALLLTLRTPVRSATVPIYAEVPLSAGDVLGLFYDNNGLTPSVSLGTVDGTGTTWSVRRVR